MQSLTTDSDFSGLIYGEAVLLSGMVFTARDKAHGMLLEKKPDFDVPPVVYHCGPLVKKVEGKWEIVSSGPTTSARMEKFLPELIGKYNISGVIGKGGVGKVISGSMKGKCVYFALTGGCGALAAKSMRVKEVHWLDLGIPEAIWVLEVKDLPLVVGIDMKGRSLYS
ncbi:MAG: hypothetical protein A7316_01680 [Candidatus Altiarchaeales archaeon WOR_SM1_86-2]|nr:MAG: hypothetical protein A7315_04385 [Candidatus Altiarchaeales archaeon WOR_SM1_79]ODS37522.1 MAG: hypothetical protein A7316_01680 [Candidatus Altiarchaeales archaeon WOR_SM1_86-2]